MNARAQSSGQGDDAQPSTRAAPAASSSSSSSSGALSRRPLARRDPLPPLQLTSGVAFGAGTATLPVRPFFTDTNLGQSKPTSGGNGSNGAAASGPQLIDEVRTSVLTARFFAFVPLEIGDFPISPGIEAGLARASDLVGLQTAKGPQSVSLLNATVSVSAPLSWGDVTLSPGASIAFGHLEYLDHRINTVAPQLDAAASYRFSELPFSDVALPLVSVRGHFVPALGSYSTKESQPYRNQDTQKRDASPDRPLYLYARHGALSGYGFGATMGVELFPNPKTRRRIVSFDVSMQDRTYAGFTVKREAGQESRRDLPSARMDFALVLTAEAQ